MKIHSRAVISLVIASVAQEALCFTPSQHRVASIATCHFGTTHGRLAADAAVLSRETNSFLQHSKRRRASNEKSAVTSLRMAAEDFNESKYTEAAWSLISSLTNVADFYQSSNVEAPLLLDLMLNPSKHNAGENVEAAKKVVEKALTKAGVNVSELRSSLESHLSQQARLSSSSSKSMGRSLQKVLETARISQSVLGVSVVKANYLFIFP